MEISDQTLNQQERLAIDRGYPEAEITNIRHESELPESNTYNHHEQDNPGNISNLQRDYLTLKSDYKNLLISYNELSSAFRTYLTNNHNDYYIEIIKDLRNDKEKINSQNKFFLEQLFSVLLENQRIQTNGSLSIDSGFDFSSIQELIFQNLFLKELINKESDDKINAIEKQFLQANNVISKQETLINELKIELDNAKQYQKVDYEMNPFITKNEEKLKIREAMVDELRKENRDLKKEYGGLKIKEKKNVGEIFKLREELIKITEEKIAFERHKDILDKENRYLIEINKELERINFQHVIRISGNKTFDEIKKLEDENQEIKKKNYQLQEKIKKMEEESNEERDNFERQIAEEQNKVKEQRVQIKINQTKYAEEGKKLQNEIENHIFKYTELEKLVENIKKELAESHKNAKKILDELESVKKITGKRLDQLEASLALKNQEISSLKSIGSSEALTKLVSLLQKSLNN